MANDESLFREVDQNLAEDNLWNNIRKRGPFVLAAAIGIVAVVGVFQFTETRRQSIAKQAARDFQQLQETLGEAPEDAEAALELFIDSAPAGYQALARMRLAALLSSEGNRKGAIAQYRAIYNDSASAQRIGDLARLRAAFLSLEDGREAVLADIGELENDPGQMGIYAREVVAMAAISAGDYQTAETMFRGLAINLDATASLRARAEEFAALASAGKSGISLDWPESSTGIDSFLDALGEQGSDLGAVLERQSAGDAVEDQVEEADDHVHDGTEGDDHTHADEEVATETDATQTGEPEINEGQNDENGKVE